MKRDGQHAVCRQSQCEGVTPVNMLFGQREQQTDGAKVLPGDNGP